MVIPISLFWQNTAISPLHYIGTFSLYFFLFSIHRGCLKLMVKMCVSFCRGTIHRIRNARVGLEESILSFCFYILNHGDLRDKSSTRGRGSSKYPKFSITHFLSGSGTGNQ